MTNTTKLILTSIMGLATTIAATAIYNSPVMTAGFWSGAWAQVSSGVTAHFGTVDLVVWFGVLWVAILMSCIGWIIDKDRSALSAETATPPPPTKAEIALAENKREWDEMLAKKEQAIADRRLKRLAGKILDDAAAKKAMTLQPSRFYEKLCPIDFRLLEANGDPVERVPDASWKQSKFVVSGTGFYTAIQDVWFLGDRWDIKEGCIVELRDGCSIDPNARKQFIVLGLQGVNGLRLKQIDNGVPTEVATAAIPIGPEPEIINVNLAVSDPAEFATKLTRLGETVIIDHQRFKP